MSIVHTDDARSHVWQDTTLEDWDWDTLASRTSDILVQYSVSSLRRARYGSPSSVHREREVSFSLKTLFECIDEICVVEDTWET